MTCLRNREVWDNLSVVGSEEVNSVILRFLNQWRCRIPYSFASRLKSALNNSGVLFSPFEGLSIERINYFEPFRHGDQYIDLISWGERLFDDFSGITCGGRSFGSTATSKLFHMVNPGLFVMSDAAIRKKHGCADNGAGYTNFMIRMNHLTRRLISEAGGTMEDLLNKIYEENLGPQKTLPFTRILDIYNVRTRYNHSPAKPCFI